MNNNFIVSLASYSRRINTLHICLESIFSQSLMPQKIILYLDNSVQANEIPAEVTSFVDKGLEIVFVSDDIGPHNKYYYTFKEYPNDIVITVDDDVIYDKNTFLNLMETHQKYPSSVCATRVTYMMFDNDNNTLSYNNWISEYEKILYPSKRLIAIGVGGILYPPHIFSNKLFNKTNIINLALTADDIWLKFMELENNISVVWSGQLPQHPKQIPNTKDGSLWRTINKYKNDEYIQKLEKFYGMNLFTLITRGDNYVG